jgi:hypothetical protein
VIPPRPTMTDADKRALREFFASPHGLAVLGQVAQSMLSSELNRALLEEPEGENFWRDMDGNRIEAEAASAEPLDPQRPFPRPMPLARPVSVNWFMLTAWLACVLLMGSLLGWIIFATIREYA